MSFAERHHDFDKSYTLKLR